MAVESNVSREIIGKYECGDATPSIDFAKPIADALGVSLDYLVGEGGHHTRARRGFHRNKKGTGFQNWNPV
ncbi:helix-turn-helix transcriptional regulator [Chitinophaga polysaccharea]|uniref:helix-turn-helix domain-containing protein n=1 Tax=Chitinophaga TaxID=79328 RepID=UPI0014550C6F|nr:MULTISPECIES: helix-turn-helix transcriptional regulator [Chitinophaga]NLR62497.1 helix-turn-helix transcriptional regulator [Chitinophaga polysaccharea]NLU92333.1 helix-turn-helix transcriptional regulator [Chitinophaga sp. Ak27]